MKINLAWWTGRVSLAAVVALCGCVTSPPARFYTLMPASPPAVEQAGVCAGATLAFGPVMLPEHLARSQLVSRETEAQLHVDEFARWGAPLPQEFAQALAAAAGRRLDAAVVAVYPLQDRYEMDWRISVDVRRFDGVSGGQVHLIAQWSVWRHGKVREFTRHSVYSSVSAPGEAMYVETLRALLQRLVDEITSVMMPLCRANSGAASTPD